MTGENLMAFYLSTPMTVSTRRTLDRWFNAAAEVSPEVSFPMDIRDEGEAYVFQALLPGVTADDLNIQIQSDVVSIQGELKTVRDEKANYLLQELPAGKFSRSLELPDPVDANKAEASLVNGVLTLRLPKSEAARPRSIKVTNK
jgi:HSP20 family protein